VLLLVACSGCASGPERLERAIERALGGCEVVVESVRDGEPYTTSRSTYDANGDRTSERTDFAENGWWSQLEATYGEPHEVTTERRTYDGDLLGPTLTAYTWRDGLLVEEVLRNAEDGVAASITTYAYDDDGHQVREERDTDADGVIDRAYTSAWSPAPEGWAVRVEREGGDWVAHLRHDARLRPLERVWSGSSGEGSSTYEGYGDLGWAERHRYRSSLIGVEEVTQEFEAVLHGSGRVLSRTLTDETVAGDETFLTITEETWSWTCP
jgi:hypothetical protein